MQQAAQGLCPALLCPPMVPQLRRPGCELGSQLPRASAAKAVASPSPPELVLSAHPDALKRRLEADRRREETREQAQIALQIRWYEGPTPTNFLRVTTPEAFLEEVAADKLVIADFFVPWCGACRRFHPALLKLAALHPDCTFLSVNGAETTLHDFVASLGVDKLPYFQFYHAGKVLSQFAANLSKIKSVRRELDLMKERILLQGGKTAARS